MKKTYISIFLFGLILAVLTIILQFFEYRYLIGNLNTDVYTLIVALIFTAVGIWVGLGIFRQKKVVQEPSYEIDRQKIKDLDIKEREYEVLQLIAQGLSNQEIADRLFLALPTIKTHTSNLYAKLDVRSRTQAVRKAQQLQII